MRKILCLILLKYLSIRNTRCRDWRSIEFKLRLHQSRMIDLVKMKFQNGNKKSAYFKEHKNVEFRVLNT